MSNQEHQAPDEQHNHSATAKGPEDVRNWYYLVGDDTHGPSTTSELNNLISSSAISHRTYVFQEGMNDWAPASSIKHFAQNSSPGELLPPSGLAPTRTAIGKKGAWIALGVTVSALAVVTMLAVFKPQRTGTSVKLLVPPPRFTTQDPESEVVNSQAPTRLDITAFHYFSDKALGSRPHQLLKDTKGNIFIAAGFGVIKWTTSGEMTKVASPGPIAPFGMALSTDGNLYIATQWGFLASDTNREAIFKLSPSGKLSKVVEFAAVRAANPMALLAASDGSIYGTTEEGGENGEGTVFRLSAKGEYTTIASFEKNPGYRNETGARPCGNLIEGGGREVFGTTDTGGPDGKGVIFRIAADKSFHVVAPFDTNYAIGPKHLLYSKEGRIYGTTHNGGSLGDGTIFTLSPESTITTILSCSELHSGSGPEALLQASDGTLYAVTGGGNYDKGAVFTFSPEGTVTSVGYFNGFNGISPSCLIQAQDGRLFGVATWGCSNYDGKLLGGDGTLFSPGHAIDVKAAPARKEATQDEYGQFRQMLRDRKATITGISTNREQVCMDIDYPFTTLMSAQVHLEATFFKQRLIHAGWRVKYRPGESFWEDVGKANAACAFFASDITTLTGLSDETARKQTEWHLNSAKELSQDKKIVSKEDAFGPLHTTSYWETSFDKQGNPDYMFESLVFDKN